MALPEIAEKKALGQYYTPEWVVRLILDRLQYGGGDILNKRLLEPGCGNGNFLHEAARRFLEAAQAAQMSKAETRRRLSEQFYGVEICPRAAAECRQRLSDLARQYGVEGVCWNIVNADIASIAPPANFDFVAGNPPYVRLHNMAAARRQKIRSRFDFCKNGIIDLFLAFFELGIGALRPQTGKLGFITPNSFIHNSTYSRFRRELAQRGLVREIIDFKERDIFADASTYNAVTLLDAGGNNGATNYCEGGRGGIKPAGKIDLSKQDDKKWNLTNEQDAAFLEEIKRGAPKIGDCAVVQYGFATLLDSAFVVAGDNPFGREEAGVLYPVIKATRHNGGKIESKIIYPYSRRDGVWRAMAEDDLRRRYPRVYAHLLARRRALEKRDLDNGAKWYEYGRSQGVQTMRRPKLVISPIIKDKVKVFKASAQTMVYSGIFLFAPHKGAAGKLWRNERRGLDDWLAVLQSERFLRYARLVGKDMRGGYKNINTKAIKEYSAAAKI